MRESLHCCSKIATRASDGKAVKVGGMAKKFQKFTTYWWQHCAIFFSRQYKVLGSALFQKDNAIYCSEMWFYFAMYLRAKLMLGHLLHDVIGKDLVLKVVFNEAELLIFPSIMLPKVYHSKYQLQFLSVLVCLISCNLILSWYIHLRFFLHSEIRNLKI